MPSKDKQREDSPFLSEGDLETPFLDRELFVKEVEPELEAHLETLISESPFTHAFEESQWKIFEPEIYEEDIYEETEEPEIESFYEREAEPQEEDFRVWDDTLEQPYARELEVTEADELEDELFSEERAGADNYPADENEIYSENEFSDLEYGTDEFYYPDEGAYAEVDRESFPEEKLFIPQRMWVEPEETWIELEEEGTYPLEETVYGKEEPLLDAEFFIQSEEEGINWPSFESELGPAIPAYITEFATNLGKEWSRLRNGSPSAGEITKWLLQDYQDTLEGARLRWKDNYNKGKYTVEAIGRAWIISRQENMKFQISSLSGGTKPLMNFKPPAVSVTMVSSKLISGSSKAPVAPITVKFVEELRQRYHKPLGVSNYRGHGGGSFLNRGYSLDLFLKGLDERKFYPYKEAIEFLKAVKEAARAIQAEWRVIYNDFSVAKAINQETGRENVIFVGKAVKGKNNRVIGLNWHGPDPLILHFHLDLAPGASISEGDIRPSTTPVTPVTPTPAITAPATSVPKPSQSAAKLAAELVRFAQRILNTVEGERLSPDGKLGPLTRGALERFRRKYSLGTGGVLDSKTEIALIQRAFEELAQQSIFAQFGFLDARTKETLSKFKSERGLGFNATIDAATRAALADAVTRRLTPTPPAPSYPKNAAAGGIKVSDKVVSMVERYRPLVEAAAAKYGVDSALIRGVIAAESGGNKDLVAKSGYTGLMQSNKGEIYKQPAVSIDSGTKKIRDFRIIMENVLKERGQRYDQLPEAEQLRLLALAYNAGPVTVAKALQYAAEYGSPERWLDGEHYKRALLFTGAYSLKQAEASCLKGMDPLEKKSRMEEAVRVWNQWRLGTKKVNWRKLQDPPLWSSVSASLPPFIVCAIEFKHRNSPKYAEKIMAYRARFKSL
ncbi:MAG: transglycosylase SLT domain-containing protein [Methanosarcina flavescens]|jgi:peptidoglycan hydrolase-like protein with peptidoglycan-binding domain|uniref:Transglycosylase SLT domain-containing protein n=1 Tax=Methanosarcina flavescens TaxID=1715806 RepID=A0A660HPK8_9EURY|nr:transglycosylase SLT domain-containing protein [Methanosarcina flavescens]AYK14184.1 hypothetical protein AOB57_002340 [Methanosarcina flavescens]NLK33168.1 transglycosylase SLT domain-containing protein [Methanosarcina flavescens]